MLVTLILPAASKLPWLIIKLEDCSVCDNTIELLITSYWNVTLAPLISIPAPLASAGVVALLASVIDLSLIVIVLELIVVSVPCIDKLPNTKAFCLTVKLPTEALLMVLLVPVVKSLVTLSELILPVKLILPAKIFPP